MMLCGFNGHERHKLFWGNLNFYYGSTSIIFCCCDCLAKFLMKRLFLTSTAQMLPIFNGGNYSVDRVFYIQLQACSGI